LRMLWGGEKKNLKKDFEKICDFLSRG